MKQARLILILDNIRSAHNVGSIFRTAACFGVEEIILSGVTPAPLDRFGRDNEKILKVALGAEKLVKWKQSDTTAEAIEHLKKEEWIITALEQAEHSIDISNAGAAEKRALIIGEETKGIEKEILQMCDEILEIPQGKEKESLNVSIAAGIAVYTLTITY